MKRLLKTVVSVILTLCLFSSIGKALSISNVNLSKAVARKIDAGTASVLAEDITVTYDMDRGEYNIESKSPYSYEEAVTSSIRLITLPDNIIAFSKIKHLYKYCKSLLGKKVVNTYTEGFADSINMGDLMENPNEYDDEYIYIYIQDNTPINLNQERL